MANDNFYPGQMSGQPLGTGEGESPLAKPTVPNMDVRTMASDMNSVQTGSPAPKPYAPQAPAPDNIPMAPVPSSSPISSMPDQSFQIPQPDSTGAPMPGTAPKKSGKGIFTALIVFVAVIGLAALGYFVIYPIFFAAPSAPAAPAAETPATPTLPTETTPPPAEQTPPAEPATTTPPVSAPAPVHASLFTTPADSQISASAVLVGSLLSSLSLNTAAAPALLEATYKDASGNLLKFSDVLKASVGLDITTDPVLATAFNDLSATGLVYVDSNNGRWLGFAAQLADGASATGVSAAFQQAFEGVSNYNSLFSSDPGTAQTWKTGQISGVTGNRYLLFSNSGFAVDYGWVGNKLIVLTSYNGFKDAASRMK